MQHVDEGRLHAYLDGEIARDRSPAAVAELEAIERHLQACTECRAKMGEARQLRDRASAVLSSSAPVRLAMPPFEQIRARAEAHKVTRGRILQMSRMRALAWAATIVLAVGVGWVARGALRTNRQAPTPAAFQSAAEARYDSIAPVEQPTGEPTAVPRPEAEAPALRSVPTGALPDRDELRDRTKAAEGAIAQAPAQPPAAPTVGEERAPQRNARADAAAAQPGRVSDSVAALLEAREALFDSATARRQREALAQRPAAQPSVSPSEVMVTGVAASKSEGPIWSPTQEGEAREYLGAELLAVADLPILGYATGTVDGQAAVRILQELAQGDTVELVLQHGVPLARDEARRPEPVTIRRIQSVVTRSVREDRGAYRIVVRGGLPEDSLRALLGRVRQAP